MHILSEVPYCSIVMYLLECTLTQLGLTISRVGYVTPSNMLAGFHTLTAYRPPQSYDVLHAASHICPWCVSFSAGAATASTGTAASPTVSALTPAKETPRKPVVALTRLVSTPRTEGKMRLRAINCVVFIAQDRTLRGSFVLATLAEPE